MDRTFRSVEYQTGVTDGLATAVDRAGGSQRLLACGEPSTGPFQVPVVAWELGVHAERVHLDPTVPAVAFRVRNTPGGPPAPALEPIGGEAGVRTFATAAGWRIVGRCRAGAR